MKIGNYTIEEKDVDQFIETLPREQKIYKDVPQFRKQIEERLEQICLFAMLGEEQKVEESDEYKEAMALTMRDIKGQLAMANLLRGVDATEEEAAAYYEEHKEEFATESNATASHILVDDEELINKIKAEIESGDKTFEEAAKEYSTCPSSAKGGSLGTFGKGQMVKEFEDAAFEGEIGAILGPVKTQFGFHLIRVDDRKEGVIPEFEGIKTQVRGHLVNKRQQEIFDTELKRLRDTYVK